MPKSEPPRKKNSKDAGRVKSGRRMADIINAAQSLDRRRVAQINNQKESITRLLNQHRLAGEPQARYTQEMEILHQGAATLRVELEATEAALRQLADACVHGLPGEAITDDIDAALAEATRIIGPMRLSEPVSESGASAG